MNKRDFLARVQESAGLDSPKEAERQSVAVLTALLHVLPDSEARRHFTSQLPGFLKSRLAEERPRGLVLTGDAFLQHLGRALHVHAPEAERVLMTVFGVLRQAVSAGQVSDLEAHLPKEIAALLERKPLAS
ncbi:MAG TPA: DUF2267 domain-containing protein [Candidatus Deferrimicrobiaceae bacterium]|nr:DUF2267 domain-containing protein [Candidatus Deferrimicrobiaceae bacterium]